MVSGRGTAVTHILFGDDYTPGFLRTNTVGTIHLRNVLTIVIQSPEMSIEDLIYTMITLDIPKPDYTLNELDCDVVRGYQFPGVYQ
jgi:hypothetical protein